MTFRLLLLVSLLFSACTSDEPKRVSSDTSSSPKAILENLDSVVGLKLLSPGQTPHKIYRYNIEESSSSVGILRMKMDMKMVINGQSPPAPKLPTMVMPMHVNAGTLSDDWIPLTSVYGTMSLEDAESVPEAVQQAVLNELSHLEGISLTWEINNRGALRNLSYASNKELPAQTKQLLEQTKQSFGNLFVVLPEEAFGLGAQWVMVLKDFDVGGILQDIRAHYTVKKLTDSSISLDVALLSVMQEQEVETEQFKQLGITAKAFPAKNFSSGTMIIDLRKPLPESEIKGTSTLTMETKGEAIGPQPQRMDTIIDMVMSLRDS